MNFLEENTLPSKTQRKGDAAITRILNNKLRNKELAENREVKTYINNYMNFSKVFLDYMHSKSLVKHKLDWKLIQRYMKRNKIWEKVVLTNGNK